MVTDGHPDLVVSWRQFTRQLRWPNIRARLHWLGLICVLAGCQWSAGHSVSAGPYAPASAEVPTPPTPPIAAAELKSGLEFASAELRAQQNDPILNPGMLWVDRGSRAWNQPPMPGQPACSSCHGPVASSMKGVSARLPRLAANGSGIENLQSLINHCRTRRQSQPELAYEAAAMLDLTAVIAYQSAGLPMNVNIDGGARTYWEHGRRLYEQRMGQINLACTHCHDQQWGKRLYNETISQGHGNAYPIYRLEWQSLGSLHRRFRSCQFGVRAPLLPQGHGDFLALEFYLAWRAGGLPIEAPGVRR